MRNRHLYAFKRTPFTPHDECGICRRNRKSAYNALYGSLNYLGNEQYCREENAFIDGLPFDSYSPLVNQKRGVGIGGYKKFSDGGYYGCCGCIGAAGVALLPLIAVEKTARGYVFNEYIDGEIGIDIDDCSPTFYIDGEIGIDIDDCSPTFLVKGDGVKDGIAEITIRSDKPHRFELAFRIPSWSRNATITINGETAAATTGYNAIVREWKNGDKIVVALDPRLIGIRLNGKTAYMYGGLVLARDERKENGAIIDEFTPVKKDGGFVSEQKPTREYESVRLILKTSEGGILLTDYASCGRHWLDEKNRISVWLNADN